MRYEGKLYDYSACRLLNTVKDVTATKLTKKNKKKNHGQIPAKILLTWMDLTLMVGWIQVLRRNRRSEKGKRKRRNKESRRSKRYIPQ